MERQRLLSRGALELLGSLLLSAVLAPQTLGHDWPQYRGPERNGISTETDLLKEWPDTGPRELFRIPIGHGFSGISVVENALFTADSDAEGQYALKLDAETGSVLWRQRISENFENNFGNGPRSTPTVAGDRVYLVGSLGHLVALDAKTGETHWSLDLKEKFGAEQPTFGFSGSPLVVGNEVYIEAGGPEGNSIVALSAESGEILWTSQSSAGAYNSPVYAEIHGIPQLLVLNRDNLVGISLEGRLLWSHPFAPDSGVKPALPIFVDPDLVFVSASYDIGAMVVRLSKEGDSFAAEEVWQSRVMRNHFNSSVLHEGRIYGFDNSALKCIEAATGKTCWAKRGGLGKGSLIYADGDFLVLSETGTLLLVEATPEGFREKASTGVLSGRCWTEPTLAHGRLYLRNREEMVALDLRRPGSAEEVGR